MAMNFEMEKRSPDTTNSSAVPTDAFGAVAETRLWISDWNVLFSFPKMNLYSIKTLQMTKTLSTIATILLIVVVAAVAWLGAQTAPPALNALNVNPAYVVVSTPTQVTFTVGLSGSSPSPSRVNLLTTDAAGNQIIGTAPLLHDDGLNGDAASGDRVFSYRLTVNQASAGQQFFRVSAMFPNSSGRVLSNVVTVRIDPFELPPDPGAAGKTTIAGLDSNHNGVRDDVERYIGLTFPQSINERQAMTQYALAVQQLLADPNNAASAVTHVQSELAAVDCLHGIDPEHASAVRKALLAVVLDTAERSGAYIAAVSHFGGHRDAIAVDNTSRLAKCTFSIR